MRDGEDGAVAVFDPARLRRILVPRLMAARLVVVLDVLTQKIAEMRFAPRDDVVGALAADAPMTRSAYGFCQGARLALSMRSRRNAKKSVTALVRDAL